MAIKILGLTYVMVAYNIYISTTESNIMENKKVTISLTPEELNAVQVSLDTYIEIQKEDPDPELKEYLELAISTSNSIKKNIKKEYKIRVRADFSEIMEVEATDFEEAEVKASQKFLDEFDPSTMSMSSLDTEEWKE